MFQAVPGGTRCARTGFGGADYIHGNAVPIAARCAMGFALHHAVAGVKAELSLGGRAKLRFVGWGVTIEAEVARAAFEDWIASDLAAIDAAIGRPLDQAGIAASGVDAVFLTGGTSFVPAVRALFDRRFARERVHHGDAFQSVASGPALIAADRHVSRR